MSRVEWWRMMEVRQSGEVRIEWSIDWSCGVVLRGLALDYGRADGVSSCSWMEPGELTM